MNDVPHHPGQRGCQQDESRDQQPAHPVHADHLVTFYESSSFLAAAARHFLLEGLSRGETIVVVATPAHRDVIAAAIGDTGHDLARSRREGRYLERDAAATLAELVIDGGLSRARFDQVISRFLDEVTARSDGLRVFGEMVALLWRAGDLDLALDLEDHWNALLGRVPVSLLCGYPLSGFDSPETTARFHDVTARHARVTTDSYAALDDTGVGRDGVVLLGAREPGGLQG